MKKIIALMLAMLICFSLVACNGNTPATSTPPASTAAPTPGSTGEGTSSEEQPVVADSLTYAARTPSWDISPWKNNGNTGNTMWHHIYSGLLANPLYGTPVENMHLDMAESVTFSDDKLTATIKLRDYIHDSKGNPIKAEDVVFSYETAPKVSGVYAKIETFIDSIKIIDEYTVEIKIKEAVSGTWESLLSYCPVVSKSWYESASDDERANNPASTGAYYVKENITGTSATFEAIDDFWQKDELRSIYQIVNVKTINYITIAEQAMRVIAVETGELDAAYIESTSTEGFKNNPEFNLFETWGLNPTTFALNCSENRPFHDNPALRKAVLHAIDWEQLKIASSNGFGYQGHDVAPGICADYDDAWNDEPYYDYDLEVAKEYMAEAGYDLNSGLTIHFMCRTAGPQLSSAAVIQSCLLDIGINLVIDDYDQALFDTYTPDPAQWDIIWLTINNVSGFVIESWAYYYGTRGELGSIGFVRDEKLQELLEAVMKNDNGASRNAFRDYAIEQAYALNQVNEPIYVCARKDIVEMPFDFLANPILNAAIFSSDY